MAKKKYRVYGIYIREGTDKKLIRSVKKLRTEGERTSKSELIDAIIASFYNSEGNAATEKLKVLVRDERTKDIDKRGGDFVSNRSVPTTDRSEKHTAQGVNR